MKQEYLVLKKISNRYNYAILDDIPSTLKSQNVLSRSTHLWTERLCAQIVTSSNGTNIFGGFRVQRGLRHRVQIIDAGRVGRVGSYGHYRRLPSGASPAKVRRPIKNKWQRIKKKSHANVSSVLSIDQGLHWSDYWRSNFDLETAKWPRSFRWDVGLTCALFAAAMVLNKFEEYFANFAENWNW